MRQFLCCLVLFSLGFLGCKRDSPLTKLVEGGPVGGAIQALPVNAVQAFHRLERDVIGFVMGITNRTSTVDPEYPELTLPGPNYSYVISGAHYGQVTINFSYQDDSNMSIDPIFAQASSETIKYVFVNLTSVGVPFNGTGSFLLTFTEAGNFNSIIRATGTCTLTEASYTVVFDVPNPGAAASFTGFSGGRINISGSGPGGAITGQITATTERELNGSLSWDGNDGQIHVKENSDTLLYLDNLRYFFD